MNILVSGVASDIGLNIGRILRRSGWDINLIGSDIHSEFYASDIFSQTHILPKVDSPEYVNKLKKLINDNSIDIFVPSSEAELRWLCQHKLSHHDLGTKLITASKYAMQIGFDKLRTVRHLESSGLALASPWSISVADSDGIPPDIPCILKSRSGAGNASVYFVDSLSKCSAYVKLFPEHMWQEFLSGDEYTCGVYRCLDKSVRVIAMRRRLAAGVSVYTKVIDNTDICNLCKSIAESLNLSGSINVQLRLVKGRGPIVFEINPRFSSTINMRDQVGFRDLLWSIQEQFLGQLASPQPSSYPKVEFSRRYEELILQ